MNTIDLVVFDIVGTTIQDRGEVLSAFTDALRESGIPAPDGELERWRGASKREVLRVFIEKQFGAQDPDNTARVESAHTRFRERLEGTYTNNGVRAVAGVDSTFTWLAENGVKTALTTGFHRQVTDIILHAVGWHTDAVDVSVCSDEVLQGRPAPYMIFRAMEATGVTDVRRVVKIGDTALDLMAGTNAGVRGVVGVLSGSQGIEQLGCVRHTHILPSVADLPHLLSRAFDRVQGTAPK